MKLDYVGRLGSRDNRECVYQFVAPDDQRDLIFGQWLNRDEALNRESVSLINNIEFPTLIAGTISDDIPQTLNQVESPATQAWKGLKLKMHLGLDSAGRFYTELVSKVGEAVGVADGEPYWNGYLNQWQVWVNFTHGCKSVVCDWLVVV